MAEKGLIPPEREVKWLHVNPGGYMEVTVISDLWSYRRHWLSGEQWRCAGEECEICMAGHPWRARYIMRVRSDDGEWLLELGGPQAEALAEAEDSGGICGARLRIQQPGRYKTSKIHVDVLGREILDHRPEDISKLVKAVEAAMRDPSKFHPR